MSLYTENDSKMLVEKVEDIMNNATEISSKIVKPTIDDLWKIVFTVVDFVKEKKRKIYGGFALNKLLESVSPDDMIYDNNDIKSWDIDFYSPSPIDDAREIANRLHAKGYQYVVARDAQHDETYKVYAETNDCADISYVPRNIYNKIPFRIVDGMYLAGPEYLMIDYFRVLTDPLASYFRLEKTFTRLCTMLKFFPLPVITKSIDIIPPNRDLDIAFRTVHEFLTDHPSTIVVGMYAYDHYIKESQFLDNRLLPKGVNDKQIARSKSKSNSKSNSKLNENSRPNIKVSRPNNNTKEPQISYVDVTYYEIISTHYKYDARELILALRSKFPSTGEKRVTYRENYPFFQYLGYNVDIFFDGEIICRMYHYNSRCTPYFDVPALYFTKGKYEELKGKIRIGSFATNVLFSLINIQRAKTNDDNNSKNVYYTMLSHMTQLRNYYLNKNNKTIFDEGLFQEFVLRCIGETTTAQMEKAIRISKKKKANKRYHWNYDPENERDRTSDNNYVFKNSSGNPINNPKNRKIDLSSNYKSDEDDIDSINDEDEPVVDSDSESDGN